MSYQKDCISFLEKRKDIGSGHKYGVSLHCHTRYSKEMLDFVPFYASRIPVVKQVFERECRRYERLEGKAPDFNTGYWEPPLTARQVFDAESDQMATLGLKAIVSITDHDSIQANVDLRSEISNDLAPVSMEWTVPYKHAYFHLGVHNLPVESADEITGQLLAYTFAKGEPDSRRLVELFAMLNEMPEVLIVFNHPIWDIEMIGQEEHNRLLDDFIADHIKWLHALEINGFRPWSENRQTIALAEQYAMPLISGGDRHCLHSNTMINVSNAGSFAEFVDEIRVDRTSQIVVTPEYHRPLALRQVESMLQIMGDYPHFAEGRRHWQERVFFDADDGTGLRSLDSHWDGNGPTWHQWLIRMATALTHPVIRPLFNLTVARDDVAPRPRAQTAMPAMIGREPLPAEH